MGLALPRSHDSRENCADRVLRTGPAQVRKRQTVGSRDVEVSFSLHHSPPGSLRYTFSLISLQHRVAIL